MPRLLKQSVYGLFFALILIFIAYFNYIFFLEPVPSCFDDKQNQDETGLDCGGSVCIPCDIKSLSPLVVQNTRWLKAGDKHILLIDLTNPNLRFGASSFTYSILGSDNNLLHQDTSFIYPGESKTIIAFISPANLSISDLTSVPASDVKLSDHAWSSRSDFNKPDISYKDLFWFESGSYLTITGTIINREPIDFSNATIKIFIYDNHDHLVGASTTIVDNLPSFSSKNFKVLYPVLDLDPSSLKVEVIIDAKPQNLPNTPFNP